MTSPRMPGVADGSPPSSEPARRPLETALLDTEWNFYRAYPWCLNAFPRLREVIGFLKGELLRLDEVGEDWQRAEVMTNVFLFSCAIADTVDDYMLGERFDFSQAAAAAPPLGPGLRALDAVSRALGRVRERRLGRLRAWRDAWGDAVEAFLRVLVAGEGAERVRGYGAGPRRREGGDGRHHRRAPQHRGHPGQGRRSRPQGRLCRRGYCGPAAGSPCGARLGGGPGVPGPLRDPHPDPRPRAVAQTPAARAGGGGGAPGGVFRAAGIWRRAGGGRPGGGAAERGPRAPLERSMARAPQANLRSAARRRGREDGDALRPGEERRLGVVGVPRGDRGRADLGVRPAAVGAARRHPLHRVAAPGRPRRGRSGPRSMVGRRRVVRGGAGPPSDP